MNKYLACVCTTQKTVTFTLTTFRTSDLMQFVIQPVVRIHSVIIHVQICLQSRSRQMSHHPVNPTDERDTNRQRLGHRLPVAQLPHLQTRINQIYIHCLYQ